MDELYEMIKHKLQIMREESVCNVMFSYEEVSQMFQFINFMKQVKELVNWGEKDG